MKTKTLAIAVTAALMSSGAAYAQRVGPGIPGEGPSNGNPEGLMELPGFTCSGQGGSNCSIGVSGPIVTSTFDISGCGTILDTNIGVDISHTWVGDLIVTVRSPNNTAVTIIDRPGVPEPPVGEGCQADDIFAVLDDGAASPVEDECAAGVPTINGTFIPNNPLSALNGLSADGTWSLDVSDAVSAFDPGTLNDWSVDVFTDTCGTPPGEIPIARFPVTKDFDDDNPAEVDVTISCNTGLPLMQTQTITEAGPGVTFVVTDFENAAMDCTITETAGVDGYDVEYAYTATTSDEGCSFSNVIWETFNACAITNTLLPVDVEVTKWWMDENPQFDNVNYAEASYECFNEQFDIQVFGSLDFLGDGDVNGFSVFPDWDGSTTCTIVETVVDSGVEFDDSECASLQVWPGIGASCNIYNTRLYEGIPTLSQYGLGLLALLMLGMGFVAYRRIV